MLTRHNNCQCWYISFWGKKSTLHIFLNQHFLLSFRQCATPHFCLSHHYYSSVQSIRDSDGLVQERRNSIANALELRLSCTNPSICFVLVRNCRSSGWRCRCWSRTGCDLCGNNSEKCLKTWTRRTSKTWNAFRINIPSGRSEKKKTLLTDDWDDWLEGWHWIISLQRCPIDYCKAS